MTKRIDPALELHAFNHVPDDHRIVDPANPLSGADLFLAERYVIGADVVLRHHRCQFYLWDRTAYVPLTDADMRADAYAWLDRAKRVDKHGNPVPFQPTIRRVNDFLDALRARSHLPDRMDPPTWLGETAGPAVEEIVACANGLLHVPTRALLPPTPKFFGLNAVPFEYDPDAGDPVEWLRFLGSLWPDDNDSIAVLQDFFGQAIAGDTGQQKIILIVGPKRSGKGTIARVLEAVIGRANACAPTLSSLGSNFGLAPLIGKQVAIISDARISSRTDIQMIGERLLAISGEDSIDVDRKYRDHWTGKLGVQFLILTNEIPRLVDASGALTSRFVVLRHTESFLGREDQALFSRLVPELPAILNWGLDGRDRMLARGHYVQPASSRELIRELEDLASPVQAFIRDKCNVGPDESVPVTQLYVRWTQWCEANGHKPGGVENLGRLLFAAIPQLSKKRARTDKGGREFVYEGVSYDG